MIEAPVQLTRCGTALRSIVRPAGESATRGVDAKLVSLISKAHDWFERLSSGRCDSVQAIAQQEQIVSSSYVTRVIYLAFLAPDIVQRIVRGEEPAAVRPSRRELRPDARTQNSASPGGPRRAGLGQEKALR